MTILILGLMCSGKSSIGKLLAKELKMPFIEMDPLILESTGLHSVQDVFAIRPSLWKENEFQVSKSLSQKERAVIACGGGFIENSINLDYFREAGHDLKIVYLRTSPSSIAKRLIASHEQATLNDENALKINAEKLFEKRDPLYSYHADFIIDTDEKMPAELAKSILEIL